MQYFCLVFIPASEKGLPLWSAISRARCVHWAKVVVDIQLRGFGCHALIRMRNGERLMWRALEPLHDSTPNQLINKIIVQNLM